MSVMCPRNCVGDLIVAIPAVLRKVGCAADGGVAADCSVWQAQIIRVVCLGAVRATGKARVLGANAGIVLLNARLLGALLCDGQVIDKVRREDTLIRQIDECRDLVGVAAEVWKYIGGAEGVRRLE